MILSFDNAHKEQNDTVTEEDKIWLDESNFAYAEKQAEEAKKRLEQKMKEEDPEAYALDQEMSALWKKIENTTGAEQAKLSDQYDRLQQKWDLLMMKRRKEKEKNAVK